MTPDVWTHGNVYESFMGRWSRRVASEFVPWLGVRERGRWLDTGCGTGALSATVLAMAHPAAVISVDLSPGYVATARDVIDDRQARFLVGDAGRLPFADGCFDAVVSGLMLNFVPDPVAAAHELARVTAPGGTAAVYVWDYADGMRMLRHFWDVAVELDPSAEGLDEGQRFPLCAPSALHSLWMGAGLTDTVADAIEVPMRFRDFEDYWSPFLGGQGPAPGYVASLPDDGRAALREVLRSRLPMAADGSISLTARAWAVRGRR